MPPTPRSLGAGPRIGAADVTVAHTAQLEPGELEAAKLMVVAAFHARRVAAIAGEFTDVDWDHALGGMHALVHDREELVAHGSVIQRRFLHAGRSWRVGYVEAVGPGDGVPAGSFKVSEMNWGGWDRVDYRVIADDGVLGFVYARD